MKVNIYSIYDTASKLYARPFMLAADGQAVRAVTDIANDAEHEIGRHPHDYILFRIGMFDEEKGELIPEIPQRLANCWELVTYKVDKAAQAAVLEETH